MSKTNRRDFIQQTGLGIAGATALSWASSSRAAGANERLRVGLIGCGGRGRYDAGVFAARGDVEVAYLADPHKQRLDEVARQFGGMAKTTDDFRRILDDKSVDAVINATPVHWHAPATILACDAGKHVYVEKPCSHNIREGRLMVEAARRANRVVQHGTQSRSTSTIREGIRLLHEGIIGDVLVARAWNIQRREGIGPGIVGDPPEGLNYDMWLGPVPLVPYRDTFFSGWNWLRRFGTGEIGNDGVHDIDYARWGLGAETHPAFIAAAGGRYFFDNAAEFPDTQQVCFEYPAAGKSGKKRMLIYEERLWSSTYPHNCDSGVEYYGSDGQMFLSRRGKIEVLANDNKRRSVDVPLAPQDTEAHVADFVDAIRTNRRPHADVEIAHLTTSLCHLGNIAIQLGRSLRFDPAQERFRDDAQANELLTRTYREGHWAVPKLV
jgi:predicted dehydrogenase